MKKQDIIDYVLHSPNNTNASILSNLIDEWVEKQDYVKNLNLEKLEDFLYTATFTDWNYSIGRKYAEKYKPKIGKCSSIRIGDFYGRNYDWFFNNQLECVVKCIGDGKKHSSVGVANVPIVLQDEQMESGVYDENFEVIPFLVLDGINEKGVACNTNVCPPGDKGYTTGTNPGKPSLCSMMIPRYILDYADSALDAVQKIDNLNIFGMYSDSLQEEIHVMICDATSTYIVEFIDNKMHVMSDQDDEYDDLPNDIAIMTNFHLTDFDGNLITGYDVEGGISPEDTTLEPHAAGVERYQILLDNYESVTSLEELLELMKSIKYTNAYSDLQNPYWYSELVGYTKTFGDLTIYQNKKDYAGIREYFENMYEHRSRDTGDTWQTVHTSIYDLSTGWLWVVPQEGNNVYTFNL